MQDNPALAAAAKTGAPVVPVYIQDEAGEGAWPMGGAARWWRHHALAALEESLRRIGGRLIFARGPAETVVRELLKATRARALYWSRRYEPAVAERDQALMTVLMAEGIEVRRFNSAVLFEPDAIANRQGRPFQVFTPFWRHCLTLPVAAPGKFTVKTWPAPDRWPRSRALAELELLPRLPWAREFPEHWRPGEEGAKQGLRAFVAGGVDDYAALRDRPAEAGTSRLSPWLHHGEIGPRQIWAALQARARATGVFPASEGERRFLGEIGWREFAIHQLHHFPHTPGQPLRAEFARFPWAEDPGGAKLRAWQHGRTGYPIVDAGMRQLWRTGWMHNRVRMIAASFLVKHLRLPWTEGAAWFWDTLVDADLANNTLGWQWSAGCGADAAPYFRIFAPVLQGQKFDAQGDYVRRWVPELARLPMKWIHCPWEAPPAALAEAGVRLGENYPPPIVIHGEARREALAAFKRLRGA